MKQAVFLLLLCGGVAGAVTPVARGEVEPADLARLLTTGEKNNPSAVASAREQALAIKRANLQDLRVDYAYGLVLANQSRYAEAARLVTRYLKHQPDDLAAWRTKIWTEMQGGLHPDALDSIAAVGAYLFQRADGASASADSATASDDLDLSHIETAVLLGTCVGYLEKIRAVEIDPETVSASKNALLRRIDPRYVPAFDGGRRHVIEQFEAQENERIQRQREAQSAELERRQQAEAELDQSLAAAGDESASAQDSQDQLRKAQHELGVLRQQLASLVQDRTLLGAQIATLEAQLTELQRPTISTRTLDPATFRRDGDVSVRPGDIFAGTATTSEQGMRLDRYLQAMAVSQSLAALQKQAYDMDRLMLSLQMRGAELAGVSQAEFQRMIESRQAAAKAERRAGQLAKQINREASKTRRAADARRATRFSTYLPLPYEQEAQRVLGWFAP